MLQIQTGQKIGPYQVEGFLGRGAFAQVFLATDAQGNRVALKVGDDSGGGRFLPRFGEVTVTRDPRAVSPDETPAEAMFLDSVDGARAEVLDANEVDELLLKEAELLHLAEGNHVPRLHQILHEDDRPILVMDHISGSTLRERIRSMEGVKLGWLLEAARILQRNCEFGWTCHGDIKPENIIITDEEEVYLIDPVPESCREDRIVTTPWYNPFLRWDQKGDAQAFAIILYELMVGAVPFDKVPWDLAGTCQSTHQAEEREMSLSMFLAYPPMRELNALTPRHIEQVFHLAMCDSGYGLDELSGDLEEFLLRS
ncbi:MAG: protein kinase domain-containing protein [Planctomycetota bacterium]|jgi:serine/threonine protein kinase